jgi:hypothetical protein
MQLIQSNLGSFEDERNEKISKMCSELNERLFDIAFVLE